MRVAWITPSVPHPEGGGGSAHEFELIRTLAVDHEIHVVSCHFTSTLDSGPIVAAGASFTAVSYDRLPYPTGKIGVARGLVRADPTLAIWLARDRIGRLAAAIGTLDADTPFDLVQITHGELAELVDQVRAPTALLLFDAMTRGLISHRGVEPLRRRRVQLAIEARRTRRFEAGRYASADGLASVSTVDAQWLAALLEEDVRVLENPVGDQFFETPTVDRSDDVVSFVGALTHGPNTDAIEWLVSEIWPRVVARRPSARLEVAGRADGDPTVERTRQLVHGVGGELHTDVPDIRPHYWRAAVVVAPLRQGSGLRNKVLHAMACGAPVVATPDAMEGVPQDAAAHAWVAADASDVAATIVDVLADPSAARRRAALAGAGLESIRTPAIVEKHTRWWEDVACRR